MSPAGLDNVGRVARREYAERVRSRAFVLSTALLAALAVGVALIPVAIRLADRATVSRIAVVAPDAALADRAVSVMDGVLNGGLTGQAAGARSFVFAREDDLERASRAVEQGRLAGAIVVRRGGDGGLGFELRSGPGLAADRAQLVAVGAFAVAILDWTASQPEVSRPFVVPRLDVVAAGAPGGPAVGTADYASRRIVGVVFVVLSFLTLVFYGLWVAAGVVAEKATRVMELLISAATPGQLVVGKMLGIGLGGLTQVGIVLVPALGALLLSDGLANGVLGAAGSGPAAAAGPSLAGLSPGLVAAFLVYFVLGFSLYAALYAGAGSLLSRPEDLQVVALPLSIPAIAGYLPAVLALSGGASDLVRVASFVPLWSPFVMVSRLAIGGVDAWELALSIGLLAATVPLATWLAIRVYRAGVVLYGQPPSLRTLVAAIRGG